MEKTYIGKTEAWELCVMNEVYELPRKGEMVIFVKSNKENGDKGLTGNEVVGKDDVGYFIANVI